MDMKVEMASGAMNLQNTSIRLMMMFKWVRLKGASGVEDASVGTQPRSMERMFVIRAFFSIIPKIRTMAKRAFFREGMLEVRMKYHKRQERTMTARLTMIVNRTVYRRGLQSTQRPKAEEKSSTQTVSAIPLQVACQIPRPNWSAVLFEQ